MPRAVRCVLCAVCCAVLCCDVSASGWPMHVCFYAAADVSSIMKTEPMGKHHRPERGGGGVLFHSHIVFLLGDFRCASPVRNRDG